MLSIRKIGVISRTYRHLHGFFHADPHPGNIFALPGDVICLVDFGMVGVVDRQTREMFVEQVRTERFKPQRVAEDLSDLAARTLKFLHQFPKVLLDLAGLLRQQKLSLQIKHDGLDKVLATHDQISNRISFAIVIAALIVGSALIVISKTPPLFYGISLFGIIGFLAAALMGIWLLVAILRSGRL
jgi:ubiquinone biosynthesis protein